jgi:DNA helicase IV
MREQVRALSTLDMNNTVFVHGAAGTGKTQLALRWAERALANGERVLLTCYNIPLADYLASQFVDQPNIVVSNFVDMFGKIEGMPDLPVPAGADSDWYKNSPVAHIVAHAGQLVEKFDTIIVDEAQDFYGEWIMSLLELHLPNGQQRLLMVGDSQQNLFERNAVDVMEEMGATQAELLLNCRNTHEIGSLLQSMGGAQVANASPDGQGVFFIPVSSTEELVSAVAVELEDLIGERQIDPANVLIVTVRTDDRDAIRKAMPGGYNCTSWEDREDDNVVCETVQRTKGLEYDTVILATTSTTVRDSLLYVGASRAVSLLTVIAPVEIGQKLGLTE